MKALEIKEKIQYGLSVAYTISGDDNVLKDYVIRVISNTLPADERDFSITTFEGNRPIIEIINAANMVSFFEDSKRIVIVKDLNKEIKGKEAEALIEYIENPNENCTILFVECDKAIKCILDYCVPVDCNRAKDYELEKYVNKLAASKGYSFHKDVARKFIAMCDNDMGKITQELKKLILFCDRENKVILEDDIKEIVCESTENKVYELTEAIQEGDKERALYLYDTLTRRGEKANVLLALLGTSFRRYFIIANSYLNTSDDDLMKVIGLSGWAFKKTKEKVLKKKSTIRGYIPTLKKNVDMLNELEYNFKSGMISAETALKEAMSHLLG